MVLNIDVYLWEEYKFKSRVNSLEPYFWFHVNPLQYFKSEYAILKAMFGLTERSEMKWNNTSFHLLDR